MPGIYVERRVRGSVDEVWRVTQTPEVHQRWDLRFTEIRYPRIEGDMGIPHVTQKRAAAAPIAWGQRVHSPTPGRRRRIRE
jgi:hypothetical protein